MRKSIVGVAVLFLLTVGPAAAATSATLEFEIQELDLETGAILQLEDPEASLSESNDGDIQFGYNADRTPPCVVMQSRSAGAAVALLNPMAFEAIGYADVAGLTFTSEIIDQPFGSDDTVVVRTAAGNHYKVGHASASDTTVTFDYELLSESVAALHPATEASLELLASAVPAPGIPAGLSWKGWRQIRSHLEQASYRMALGASSRDQVAAASFEANNRRHKMRTVFDRESVRVIPTDGTKWQWGLKLRAYGYEGSTHAPQGAELKAVDNRLEYRRGDLVEWYINDGRGLEQGFTLSEQPGKRSDRDLLIELEFDGSLSPDWKQGSEAIVFTDAEGQTVLHYGGLLAWDARGRHLPVVLAAHKGGFALRVDDRQAVYPITIDPIVTNETVKLLASDGAAGDLFGIRVAVSGDTALVGALFDDDFGSQSGAAYVFQRDAGGADNWGQVKKLLASDAATRDLFGYSVAVSGDTALVGAVGDDDKGGNSGSAYVFQRDAGGTDNWGQVKKLLASDGAVFDEFGHSVGVSGDTTLVGALLNDDNGSNSGSAYVFQRDAGGTDNWGEITKLLASDGAASDNFGYAVAVSGATALVGARLHDDNGSDSGAAYVFVSAPANSPPIANAGPDQTAVECTDRGPARAKVTLNGAGSSDPDSDPLTYTWTGPFPEGLPAGTVTGVSPMVTLTLGGPHIITLVVNDGTVDSASDTVEIAVVDTTPPLLTLVGANPQTLECNVDAYAELGATALDACEGDVSSSIVIDAGAVDPSTLGSYPVTYDVADGAGNAAAQLARTVNVVDTATPVISVAAGNISLWPPNHKYHTVSIGDFVTSVSDDCDTGLSAADVVITSVSSDEPENVAGGGDGNTLGDIVIAGNCQSVNLRSERQGGGNGRVYTIHVAVNDASGNPGTASFQVEVSHNKKATATDDGPAYNVSGCSP